MARWNPIAFERDEVKAILDGHKTQTRRLVSVPREIRDIDCVIHRWERFTVGYLGTADTEEIARWEPFDMDGEKMAKSIHCPYGDPGDKLYVRETWCPLNANCDPIGRYHPVEPYSLVSYQADHLDPKGDGPGNPMPWRPSPHMPLWASRITLEVLSVNIQTLNQISMKDVFREGVIQRPAIVSVGDARSRYKYLWDKRSRYRKGRWKTYPWVWVISFAVVEVKEREF